MSSFTDKCERAPRPELEGQHLVDLGPNMQRMDGEHVYMPDPPEWVVEVVPSFDLETCEPEPFTSKADKRHPFSLLLSYFPDALDEVCKASEYGALKYAPGAWRSCPQQDFEDATVRHLLELARGRLVDLEPQRLGSEPLYHWAQVAWNALAVMQKILERSNP